jgi:hypothetical protein
MTTTDLKKSLSAALAALTMTASLALTSSPAAADHGRHGAFAAGLLGGLAVGAIAASATPYYPAPNYGDCWIDNQPVYNHWGYFVGYRPVRVCN